MSDYKTCNICELICGDTWDGFPTLTFTRDGLPLDLNGSDIEFAVKYSFASPKVLSLTTANSGVVITDASLGMITIPPIAVDIPPGKYQWYLRIKFPNGIIKTYFKGKWEIFPNIPPPTDYERRNY
jgi:hypothetical protein